MSKKDFYDVLSVSKNANAAEMKKAFRKKAMKYHPDRNPDSNDAEAKFKEINEAYNVLSDPQKKAAYDQMGHAAFEQGIGRGPSNGGSGGAGFNGNFEDIFEDFFGDIFGGAREGRGRPSQQRGADLRYNVSITLEEAFNGKKTRVTIPKMDICDACDGSGAKAGTNPVTCTSCGGSGQVRVSQGFFSMTRTCPHCMGQGQIIKEKCTSCGGTGRKRTQKTIDINIPKGVDDGTRIRLTGEGEAGPNGGLAGDLYIFINLKQHKLFIREQNNLHIELPLPMLDAALGADIEVPTPEGKKARINIPEGTPHGKTFRLKGKGMPIVNRGTYGDLMVHVSIEIPTKLSKKQKSQLEEMRDCINKKNYPEEESFLKRIEKFWKAA